MTGNAIERQKKHFDSITDAYVEGRQNKNHIAIKKLIWEEVVKGVDLQLPERFKVLEPMCGTGEGLDMISSCINDNFDYAGFDYSQEIVTKAKAAKPDANIWWADATSVDLPQDFYDIAIILGGLHHVPFHVSEVMTRVANSLKPNGYFINFEPTSGNPLFNLVREGIYRKNRIFDEQTERGFTVDELNTYCQDSGLSPVKTIYPGLAAYVMYYNPYAFPLLNIGSTKTVERIFALDRLFVNNNIGRFFSFATFSIWKRDA